MKLFNYQEKYSRVRGAAGKWVKVVFHYPNPPLLQCPYALLSFAHIHFLGRNDNIASHIITQLIYYINVKLLMYKDEVTCKNQKYGTLHAGNNGRNFRFHFRLSICSRNICLQVLPFMLSKITIQCTFAVKNLSPTATIL